MTILFSDRWRRLVRAALIAYVVVSIPVVVAFAKNEYLRFVYLETVTHWYSKLTPIKYVFIGDSITAAGRNWGIRLTGNPLAARNLGANGLTIAQVHDLTKSALTYRPQYIVVMAGTNDIMNANERTQDVPSFLSSAAQDYAQMLDDILCAETVPIVTLIPYTANRGLSELVSGLNDKITALAQSRRVDTIDLNDVIAPDRVLLEPYSKDGVHLSDGAYRVWADRILSATGKSQSSVRANPLEKCPKGRP